MDPTQREMKRKRLTVYFIEVARRIIDEEGMENLTVRKVAEQSGYTSATIYSYFDSVEHLFLLCTLTYLREYTDALNVALKPEMNALERYCTVLTVYDSFAFRSPEVFYNLFVGKYSAKLLTVIPQYYELFPEELEDQLPATRRMLTQGAMNKRDAVMVEALAAEGFIRPENSAIVADMLTRLYQSFLLEMCKRNTELDPKEHHRRYMEMLEYIIDRSK